MREDELSRNTTAKAEELCAWHFVHLRKLRNFMDDVKKFILGLLMCKNATKAS